MIANRGFKFSNLPSIIKMYIIFGINALITGLFVASDYSHLLSSLITYFSFALVCFECWYITYRTGSMNWIFRTIKLVALLCSVYTIIWGVDYYNGIYVITMSSHNNPNTLGIVMVFGIFSLLYNLEKFNKNIVFNLFILIMFLYTTVLTGSRKSLIACIALIAFWLTIYIFDLKNQNNPLKSLIIVLLLMIGGFIVVYYLNNYFAETASFKRLLSLFSEGGSDTRKNLYALAFEYWKMSPVFGIGFNHYRLFSPVSTYSHSTYAEILSCTGIIGTLIFFLPLIKQNFIIIKQLFNNFGKEKYLIKICLLMCIIEFFLGFGQIFIYGFSHMLILFCITWLPQERNVMKR